MKGDGDLTFEELEWDRPVYTDQAIVQFKRYGDKLFWWNGSINDWQDTGSKPEPHIQFYYVTEHKEIQ